MTEKRVNQGKGGDGVETKGSRGGSGDELMRRIIERWQRKCLEQRGEFFVIGKHLYCMPDSQ